MEPAGWNPFAEDAFGELSEDAIFGREFDRINIKSMNASAGAPDVAMTTPANANHPVPLANDQLYDPFGAAPFKGKVVVLL